MKGAGSRGQGAGGREQGAGSGGELINKKNSLRHCVSISGTSISTRYNCCGRVVASCVSKSERENL
jgi:hypothetical protein